MTPAALELKRWREMLAACQRARHLVQAMRTPAARLVRFERAASDAYAKALGKLARLRERHGLEDFPRPTSELVDRVKNLAEACKKDDRRIRDQIAKLTGRASKPAKPIEQRIKARRVKRVKAAESDAKFERAHAKWQAHTRESAERLLGKGPTEKQAAVLGKIAADPAANNAMNRSILRHDGAEDFADELLACAKGEPKR